MKINKNKIINSLLCCNDLKFPLYKSHYITGKEINLLTNFICIENTLTNLTYNVKNMCFNSKKNINK